MTPREAQSNTVTNSQKLYIRYLSNTLIDLAILNLFEEYWAYVTIDSFTISIIAAALLQILLKLTLAIEHRVAAYFKARPAKAARFLRVISTWLILFVSKFVMLGVIDLVFGDHVLFTGPIHGAVAFIVVVLVMVVAENAAARIYRLLGDSDGNTSGGKP